MDTNHVLTLFAEANPVPDVDVVQRAFDASLVDLAVLELRSKTMDTKYVEQLEPAAPPQRRIHPALVFASALVVVFVTVAGGIFLMRGDTQSVVDEPTTTAAPVTSTVPSVTTTAPPPTTAAPPVTVAAPIPPPLGEGWQVVVEAGDNQPTMAVEFVDGIGWIAVGGPHVMTSVDGTTWVEGDTEGVILDDAGFLSGIVAGGPGVLAYGRTCEGGGDFGHEPFPCPQEPVLYGSADGLTWERVGSEVFRGCVTSEATECYAGIGDLAASSDGSLLAAGPDATSRSGAEGDPYITESAIWTSEDGMLWQRHDIELNAFAPEGWNVWSESLEQLIYTGDRWLARLELDRYVPEIDDWEGKSILLASADGIAWSVADTGDAFIDGYPDDVARSADGLLAVGGQTTWWSSDGQTWVLSRIPGDNWFDRVISLESGFVLYNREGPKAFAFAPDGITWTTFSGDDDLVGVGWNDLAGIETALDEGDGVDITLVGVGYHWSEPQDAEDGGGPPEPVIMYWSGFRSD
jgi:hypothetical protein